MNRRNFLSLAFSSSAAVFLLKPFSASLAKAAEKIKWRNWSGNLIARPKVRFAPKNTAALKRFLKKAPTPIRAVGAGHSFSPLVPSDGSILSLDLMGGVLAHTENSALMGAGGRLRNLSHGLAGKGLAFRNLPDIDKQSLAGAISTATHGTGKGYGSLSAEVQSLKLMTARGEIVKCSFSENADIFAAARVGLGALGILTEIEMRVRSSHRLHRTTWFEPFAQLLGRADDLWNKHNKFEFYYLPFTDYCLAISHDHTSKPATPRPASSDDDGLRELQFLRDWFSWSSSIRKTLGKNAIAGAPTESIIGESYELLSSAREVRFNEMEYHIPAQDGLKALDEVKRVLETNHDDVFFPIEVRYIKGDDAWLSPFQNGDRISIAVHAYYKDSYKDYFDSIEKIFKKYKGRPHWGKINQLTKKDFQTLYPDWEKFSKVRQRLDGQGKFLNSYLRELFA